MQNLLIKIDEYNGRQVTTSRNVAENLGKRHSNVVRDLEGILENSNLSSLIIPAFYEVEGQKRKYKEYLLTKDGFILYMFNIQGHNDMKLAYINEFNRMKDLLKTPQQKRLYYKKVPVMTVDMLAKELNISTVTVNKMLYKLDDGNVLTGNELKYFKKENNYKSSCSLLRIIYHRVADTIARNLGKQLSDYFLFDCDKYKLPLEQMQIALKQADNLARIGKQISNKEDKDFVLMKASEILVNIGLWDNKEDTDYDINSLDGWNKKCKIGNNLGYINR
ncbi:Rha family transcriptional regulator [Gemella sp. Musashino-2025]